MANQLNDIVIIVNDIQISYTSDSLSWSDGLGEYSIRNAVTGGGQTEQIFSEDLSSKFGMVKFSMPTSDKNEQYKRAWKLNKNRNVVDLVGAGGSSFTKSYTQAAILNDPESSAATDGNIEIEFRSNPAT